ncbi:hypothetical protein MAIT1_00213 [Magnetofaba australis IT-1]|uniref:Tudor domain-containing protein n=1 Tax=Magnetofaba australis IT-1 TaxID=1434232 RepID=A0A1Y2KAR9_9PROT|nr:hypothetical protein MAIT1_00213 [Magnetofaba australis IT-1]
MGDELGKAIGGLFQGLANELADGADDRDDRRAMGTVTYAPGEHILGQWTNGKWHSARIRAVTTEGYHLLFDDGDTLVVGANQIAPFSWSAGTRVQCKWQQGGTYYNGVIARISGDKMRIRYDDGDQETTTTRYCRSDSAKAAVASRPTRRAAPAQVQPSETRVGGYGLPSAPPNYARSMLGAGDRCLGKWTNGYWYPARIRATNGSTYALAFDDGDSLKVGPGGVKRIDWRKGSLVQCKLNGRYADATVGSAGSRTLLVHYHQGGSQQVPLGVCRSQ